MDNYFLPCSIETTVGKKGKSNGDTVLMKRFAIPLLVLMLFAGSLAHADQGTSVTFLNPGGKDDAFFGMMTEFMQAAAEDLGFSLEVIYCDRDHLKMDEEGRKLLQRKKLPEYLILINEKNSAVSIMLEASALGIKVALINEGLQGEDVKALGGPGERVANWVLEMLPDDEQAGYMLARTLLDTARSRGLIDEGGYVHLVGLAGTFQTGSSTSRVQGLRRAIRDDGRAILHQVVPAYWEEEKAKQLTPQLLSRYPETQVVWAASDLMAIGAYKGTKSRATSTHPVIYGGIDWAEVVLPFVADDKLAATVGGHFMDGAWALVVLYDLHNGYSLENPRYLTEFSLITEDNAIEFLRYFGRHDWNVVDFRRFSKAFNKNMTHYRFGLKPVMEQLRQNEHSMNRNLHAGGNG